MRKTKKKTKKKKEEKKLSKIENYPFYSDPFQKKTFNLFVDTNQNITNHQHVKNTLVHLGAPPPIKMDPTVFHCVPSARFPIISMEH
jgi:hypothetical protein